MRRSGWRSRHEARKRWRTKPDPYGIGAVRPSDLRVGMAVDYFPILPMDGGASPPVRTTIASEPWQTGDERRPNWLVKVDGRAGGVCVKHVRPVPSHPFHCAPLWRCMCCGCPAEDHAVDDEERRQCLACECEQYTTPEAD